MPRSRYSSNSYSYDDNFRPPASYSSAHNPDVSLSVLFSLIFASVLIVYHILHALLSLPPLSELVFIMIGAVLGPAIRESLQSAFSSGGRSVAERVRTRAVSLVGGALLPQGYGKDGEGFVGGLWNAGNTCYQNSVLQAMASLTHLKPHLVSLSVSEYEDDLNPSGALMSLITTLNSLSTTPRAFTPSPVIVRGTDNSGWVYNEQQDAQEFFQKLTGSLEKEVLRFLDKKKRVIRKGLEGIVEATGEVKGKIWHHPDLGVALGREYRSPFEGLFAQRVGCLKCGYVESISLQPFTSLSLSLPSSWACSLEECLDEFTTIEKIQEVDCDKCTLISLHHQLLALAEKPLSEAVKAQLIPRIEALEAALENDNFNPQIPGVKISPRQKVSTTKTKQTMIARPPPVLVLHLNRSQYDIVTGMTGKNYASVSFPPRMDLGRLGVVTRHDTVDGSWGLTVDPARRMSGRIPRWFQNQQFSEESSSESATPDDTPGASETETEAEAEESTDEMGTKQKSTVLELEKTSESVIYDLRSVVAHYGGHHNGHYVCYRKYQRQWFKISDHEVYACDEREALGVGNAFMLFYERVTDDDMNGDTRGVNGYTIGTETPEYSDTTTGDDDGDEETGEDEDYTDDTEDEDTLLYSNSNGSGDDTGTKGLRRRRQSSVEHTEIDHIEPTEVSQGQ